MKRENFVLDKEDNWEPESFDIDDLETKLYSSKHHIQRLKESLQNYKHKKYNFLNQLNDLQEDAAKVQAESPIELKDSLINQNRNNALIQTEKTIEEIRTHINLMRAEEGKLRQDKINKDRILKDFKLQKTHLIQEIADYKQLAAIHENRNHYLDKALKKRQRMMEESLLEVEKREKKLVKSLVEQIDKLSSRVKKDEGTIAKYKNKNMQLKKTINEKTKRLALVEEKLCTLLETKNRHQNLMKELRVEYQEIMEKWAVIRFTMPIQEEENLNNIKRGSWIQLVWNWWNNESQTEYLAKNEELQNTIKELQTALGTYEHLLEKMNSHFDHNEKNEQSYIKEIMELKGQLQVLIKYEDEYLAKTEKLESELVDFKEKNIELEQKLREMELRAEEYKSKVENLKKKDSEKTHQFNNTLRSLQENEQRNAEKFQRAMAKPLGRDEKRKPGKNPIYSKVQKQPGSPVNSMPQKRGKQLNQTSQAQQRSQSKMNLIKKFYPQAQSQSSVFNPFKY